MPRSQLFRSLPYLVHTNRELGLMLKGLKPFAMFSYYLGNEIDCLDRYLRMFDRHVVSGRFERREQINPVPGFPHLLARHIYYTLPGEGWRVEALLELYIGPREYWSVAHERRLGELLGYEDWQNNVWLKDHFREAVSEFGTAP